MNVTFWQQHWALLAAAFPAACVIVALSMRSLSRSAGSQLRDALTKHRKSRQALRRAHRRWAKATRRFEKLSSVSRHTKPRLLREADEARADAEALAKIAADRALVSANHVRRVIHEEFPPSRHADLRNRHLPDDDLDVKQFSFGN